MKRLAPIVAAVALLCAGCGNQMMRQPSYQPLDMPRAAPPVGAVPAAIELTPTDGRPAEAKAFGAPLDVGDEVADEFIDNSVPEPNLPPPNESDQARYQPTPRVVDSLKAPIPLTGYTVMEGRDMFLNRCVQCHNSSGYGYGPVGEYIVPHPPDLASQLVQKRSDGAIFWHISMGQGKMPPFRTWTTPAQRWQLTAYVRSLKGSSIAVKASDTRSAPYPVYGGPGFEDGVRTTAYESGDKPHSVNQPIRATHFWEWSHDSGLGGVHAP